jgi:hypothetical protein
VPLVVKPSSLPDRFTTKTPSSPGGVTVIGVTSQYSVPSKRAARRGRRGSKNPDSNAFWSRGAPVAVFFSKKGRIFRCNQPSTDALRNFNTKIVITPATK